jgi:hypothetical protein
VLGPTQTIPKRLLMNEEQVVVRDEHGQVALAIMVSRDVTELRHLRRRRS